MIPLKCKLNHFTPTQNPSMSFHLAVSKSQSFTDFLLIFTNPQGSTRAEAWLSDFSSSSLQLFPLPHYEVAMLDFLLFLKDCRCTWALSTCSSCFPLILLACSLTSLGSFTYLITLFKNKISLSFSILWLFLFFHNTQHNLIDFIFYLSCVMSISYYSTTRK